MISVCIASYNGQKWIELQIRSVLLQLDESDEVVIVDDASTDQTLEVISSISDTRIRIFHNEHNLGVIKTFEKSILLARGQIIFLCDQDDVWHQDKISIFIQAFKQHPETTLILSDAHIIDAAGSVTEKSYFNLRGGFKFGVSRNVIKNNFLGCTMAFKSSLSELFLPFPNNIPMHDMWIGIMNEIYGKTLFLDTPLIGYRRHNWNATTLTRKSVWQIIAWRLILVSSLLNRVVRNTFRRALSRKL